MRPVPRNNREDEDSIAELKRRNEAPIIKKDEALIDNKTEVTEEVSVSTPQENGYLTVLKNVPFLCVMLANLPAVMGLYIPYMFLPGVSGYKEQRGRFYSVESLHFLKNSLFLN